MLTDLPSHNSLREFRPGAERADAPTVLKALEQADRRLRKSVVFARACKAGDVAPRFVLPDEHGRQVSSVALLERGPLVVSFYRGDWCPYRSQVLQETAQMNARISALDATLVSIKPALAPETPQHQPGPESRRPWLVDAGSKVARKFGVTVQVAPELRPVYAESGFRPTAGGNGARWDMALHATFVVEPSGRIILSYLDTDFRARLGAHELLTALSHLRPRRGAAANDFI